MIINIRGSHGSGKSTLIHQLLKKYPHELLEVSKRGRPEGYRVIVEGVARPLFVVGPYATTCGGCDAIQPYDTIWPRVLRYAKLGHVIFEGALISVSIGSIGEAMAKRKDCVVAYLDTPAAVCIDRIAKRRAASGKNHKELNTKNVEQKCLSTSRTRPKFEALGVRCVTLRHKKAYYDLMEVVLEGSQK